MDSKEKALRKEVRNWKKRAETNDTKTDELGMTQSYLQQQAESLGLQVEWGEYGYRDNVTVITP